MIEDIVTARAFELVDNDGNRRAFMGTDPKGNPLVQFYTSKAKIRIQLGIDPSGRPGLILFNENEQITLNIVVAEDGSGIRVYDDKNIARAIVCVDKDGTSSFELWKTRHEAPVMMKVKSDGSYEGTFERLPMQFVSKPRLELVKGDDGETGESNNIVGTETKD